MDLLLIGLFGWPVLVSLLLLLMPAKAARPLVVFSAVLLSALALAFYLNWQETIAVTVPAALGYGVAAADGLLLLYFGFVAIRRRHAMVGLMSVLQLAGLIYLVLQLPSHDSTPLQIDRLSAFMFLLINVISGIIAVFSLRYMAEEDCSAFRKKFFLSVIFWFIAAMNLVVSADNLEYFFLFFELTTLASFLFIGFRRDPVSVRNSLTALWMNQLGGLALLAAILFIGWNGLGEARFSTLLALAGQDVILLPLALIAVAALIKGAQMPFSGWLLGAMVAPTPVSALLHSSTMVKIAPFVFIRLAPALQNTPVATVVMGLTGFVFLAAAIAALSQDNFKRILAHSTIALLALMILMAAAATPVTLIASLILILFHGISKCMLFLNAGILEKVFHLKQSSDMDRLSQSGPFTALVMLLGFLSLLLPPFGAFIGKWMSIETLGSLAAGQRLTGALLMVAIAGGGAVLSLLYFKVMGLLINRTGDRDRIRFEKTGPIYADTIYILLGFLLLTVAGLPYLLGHYFSPVASAVLGVPAAVSTEGWSLFIGTLRLPLLPLVIAFFLLPVSVVAAIFVRFRNVDRAREYACGEKVEYSFSSLYFATDRATPYFYAVGAAFFITLILVTLL